MDDRDLVRRMHGGDEAAFSVFFDAYYPRLYRFALSRVRREDAAEEIAQAAIVISIRKIDTWRGEAVLFTWLCTLCRHEISAYCKTQKPIPRRSAMQQITSAFSPLP
jgi:RNA polymerase sigma-70 factor (ECF subfamily)